MYTQYEKISNRYNCLYLETARKFTNSVDFRFDFHFVLIFPYFPIVIRDVRQRFPKWSCDTFITSPMTLKTWWWLILNLIGSYILKTSTVSVGISIFRKIRNKIGNYEFTVFFHDINFHAIIVEMQLIKHDSLTHCLTCNFHHMSQYNSFPSVWRGLTEHRREHPVYFCSCFGWIASLEQVSHDSSNTNSHSAIEDG